jgi:hypothetical protein
VRQSTACPEPEGRSKADTETSRLSGGHALLVPKEQCPRCSPGTLRKDAVAHTSHWAPFPSLPRICQCLGQVTLPVWPQNHIHIHASAREKFKLIQISCHYLKPCRTHEESPKTASPVHPDLVLKSPTLPPSQFLHVSH